MNIIKKCVFITIITAISLQLASCGSNTQNASYASYPNETDLMKKADIVINGEITKVNKAERIIISADKKESAIYTVSDVKVIEVIKGNVKVGDTIKVKQLGDVEKDKGNYYKTGEKYILFLATFEDILPGTPYEELSPFEGNINVSDGTTKVHPKNKLFKNNEKKEDVINKLKGISQ